MKEKDFYLFLKDKLRLMKTKGLYRQRNFLFQKSLSTKTFQFNNKRYINFTTNDYLGLAYNKSIKKRLALYIQKKRPMSSSSSALISGYLPIHYRLEKEISYLKKKQSTMLFSSGYLANLSIFSIAGKQDLILSDALNHASIIDGLKLSRANVHVYPHFDFNYLDIFLKKTRKNYRHVFIISESIFSMDGDILNLENFYQLSYLYNLIPIIDEAHSSGVLGKAGAGIESHFNHYHPQSIIIGTLGKAYASQGAFISARKECIDYLINFSRPFIFTTALSPISAYIAYLSINYIKTKKGLKRLNCLYENIEFFRKILYPISNDFFNSKTPIQIFLTKKIQKAMDYSDFFLKNQIFLKAIRYPAVSYGEARIRISLSSLHKKSDIEKLADLFLKILKNK